MAEFQVVAKELERMCNTIHAVSGKCCTDECPLYCEDLCYAQAMVHVHGDDACNLEKVVMSWAAENPEPVYPTIAKYLEQFGITIRRDGTLQADFFKAHEPMSADMAKLLGISLGESENEKTD